MSEKQSWLKTFGLYLKSLIQPDYGEIPHAERVRSFVKFVFDFIRNLLIVGVLKYFATKTESKVIGLIAEITFLLLIVYCMSYVTVWTLRPFHPLKTNTLRWAEAIIGFVVFVILWLVMRALLTTAVDELAKANAR